MKVIEARVSSPRCSAFVCGLLPPPGTFAGTWECRLPGIEYRNRPPILYVAETVRVAGHDRSGTGLRVKSTGARKSPPTGRMVESKTGPRTRNS